MWVKDAASDPRRGKTARVTAQHSFVQTEMRFLLAQKTAEMVLYAGEPIQMQAVRQAELCLVASGIYWSAGLQPKEVASLVSQPELNFYFVV